MTRTHNFKTMSGLKTPVRTQADLFFHCLKDIYGAEKLMLTGLETMHASATLPSLKAIFLKHHDETMIQIQRLEEIFLALGEKPAGESCQAMHGLITEGQEIVALTEQPVLNDGLVMSAEAIEHYEVARYTALIRLAERLEQPNIVKALKQNLTEEQRTIGILADYVKTRSTPKAVSTAQVRKPAGRPKAKPSTKASPASKKTANASKPPARAAR